MGEPLWDGAWVCENLGVTLEGSGLTDLVGLALRRNPKRAHLLVSHVLGKHVPAAPSVVTSAAAELARRVRDQAPAPYTVLGYAETATGLGHGVAAALGSDSYLHSTRREVPGARSWAGFEEEHSHATGHLLLPEDPPALAAATLVLVDDELSTGRTVANTLRSLPAASRHLAAALVDVRAPDADAAPVASLARGRVILPDGLPQRANELIGRFAGAPAALAPTADLVRLPPAWPAAAREGGRHGFGPADVAAARAAARLVAEQVSGRPLGPRMLVLGCEELMYAPTLVAEALEGGERVVHVSSTTRSPVAAIDEPGYAVRTVLCFPAHDAPAGGPAPRYAYNVAPGRGLAPYTDIVLIVDDAGDTAALWNAAGLVEALRGVCERVYVAVIPAHRPAPR